VGAVGLSQFPEYAQQYEQRLGGAVDALGVVVADFDRSASAEGLTRSAALAQMTGTDFLDRRRGDMEATFARHAALSETLANLQTRGGIGRLGLALDLTDTEIARAAWQAYEPAIPTNATGLGFAGIGAVLGGSILVLLQGLIRRLLRRFGGRTPA